MKNNIIIQRIVSCVLIIGMLSSCNHYRLSKHMPTDAANVGETVTEGLADYVVVHVGDETWQLIDIEIENNQITGSLTDVDTEQVDFYERVLDGQTDGEYNAEDDEGQYLEQTHIYLNSVTHLEDGKVSFDVSDVSTANSLKKQGGMGVVWGVIAGVLIVIGGLILGMVIFVLIACNCPHAYTYDGEAYNFTNTLFTGATAKNLERNDYKLMPDYRPESDSYEMIIKNEENESHYTNLLELVVVNHDADVEVVPDQNGNIHSISNLETAKSIVDANGGDLSNELSYRDDVVYSFDKGSEETMINTYATFAKPDDVSNAKVVLKLKNTEWGGVVFKTFASMMGNKYDNWVEKNHARTPEEAEAGMKEAGIPMQLSIKKGDEWVEIESVDLVGEVSYNTLAFPIDESLITGENIEVRLQAGYKFWDLDYVGMDFSQDSDLVIETIKPSIAKGSSNDLAALSQDDDLYMQHFATGDSTHIKFDGLKSTGEKRTIIMRSKGYYLSNDEYTGTPYWRELVKLKAPGGLSRLSQNLYLEFSKNYAFKAN